MNIKKLKMKLWDEQKRLEQRMLQNNTWSEIASLRGSLLTVKKILGWCEE